MSNENKPIFTSVNLQQANANNPASLDVVKELIAESEGKTAQMMERVRAEVLEEARKELAEEIKSTEKKIGQIVDDAKKEMATQIQVDKVALMSIFSIFAFVLSFLTIEFRFLQSVESVGEILAFTLILCSLLLCFPLSLDYLITSRMYDITDSAKHAANKRFCALLAIIVALFAIGIWFISTSR